MILIDGRKVAAEIRASLAEKIKNYKQKPAIVFILVGEDPGSQAYVRMKKKAALEIGVISHVLELPHETEEEALLEKIRAYNEDETIDGILVQQPLPKHIDSEKIVNAVLPKKDVDGFHPTNLGKLLIGQEDGFISCTPLGVLRLLEYYKIPIAGQHVVIVGRSNIVGKPLAALLVQKKPHLNATVTICHSRTKDLKSVCLQGDILIAAIGKAGFIKKDMVKKGATVIDVGISRVTSSNKPPQIVGDVDFEGVKEVASAMTPVPRGVGPMTIAMLMENTISSFLRRQRTYD
ncbi:MAG: bifunctional methylenetetrahydrofolate dehydrogenase/methenyltetrahydrofolate cyclohydrolase FolD [Chlamydiota bacterium]|jgi:methylenetetrahydrofolate dehydrogenase (NADP+)/methenyltetrahydrofolate cyclohydrolase